MKFNSKSWAEIAVEKLASLKIPVILSVNKQQLETYELQIPHLKLIVDQDLKIKGPLSGVLSVHGRYKKEDLFILACDMLNMNESILEQVLRTYERYASYDCFIYSDGHNSEPLCGIYKASFLDLILKKYSAGLLEMDSVKYALEQGQVCYMEIPEEHKKYFRSFNTLEEFRSLE